MKIHTTCLDHVVLNVSDLEASRRWASVTRTTRDFEGEVSLRVGGQAIRLREGTPAPRGSVSVCLVADASIHELYERAEQLHAVHGSVHPRTGPQHRLRRSPWRTRTAIRSSSPRTPPKVHPPAEVRPADGRSGRLSGCVHRERQVRRTGRTPGPGSGQGRQGRRRERDADDRHHRHLQPSSCGFSKGC